ncbi:MAG: tRNA lysidine(34) synthetase TilS [Clostridia bacterium]|nr:tRNA lysidine(34) synthetase TilS [Clostridia bacterium]
MDKKIEYAIKTHGMEDAFGRVIIGFSGGADSSLLLHWFSTRAREIVCVHVNHMIRGGEADRDQHFCSEMCKKYGVELVVHKIDIPSLAEKRGKGIEETAREERYRVFQNELRDRGFDAILTAHNGDDNLESVIFNLTRGTGLNGLGGIKPKNGNVLRPLIYLSKEEIFSYCNENNIEYVTDSTNEDTDYTRNYIRHIVAPALKKINPELNSAIGRMTEGLMRDESFILSQAKDFVLSCNKGCADIDGIRSLSPSVRARVLKLLAGRSLDYKGICACEDIIFNSECGSYVELSSGLAFKRERDYVHFIPKEALCKLEYSYELTDTVHIDELGVTASFNELDASVYERLSTLTLSMNSIKGELVIRSRRDGDRILHNGMTKKIKRILCDKHIPSHLRDRIPIICDGYGIVALYDICLRDGCKYNGNGEKIKITFYKSK